MHILKDCKCNNAHNINQINIYQHSIHQLKIKCQSQCNKNAEVLQEKLQNKRNFNGMEQKSHSFGQFCTVLLIMTYVRNMPRDITENTEINKKKLKK
jgi:hypothetical protein